MLIKLIRIQHTLKAPKNQFNKFGGFSYRSLEDVLEAVKPLCFTEGLLLTLDDEVIEINNRFYVKATATITDGTNSVTASAWAREEEARTKTSAPQITGGASSYARKYALSGLFCIDDNRDPDTMNNSDYVGNSSETESRDSAELARYLKKFRNAQTLEALKAEFLLCINKAQSEVEKTAIVTAKNQRKEELESETAN